MNAASQDFAARMPAIAGPDALALRLERDALGSFDAVCAREWLVTNGLGGYASGTISGPEPGSEGSMIELIAFAVAVTSGTTFG